MYDLLIRSGRVIDPAQNIDDILDVAVSGGKIAAIGRDIAPHDSRRVIDAQGKIVTPGLIDLHCHVYEGVFKLAVEPDTAGVRQGVTTLADGGSAGEAIFDGFPKYIIRPSRTTIFAFLNLLSQGLTMRELIDRNQIDIAAAESTIESNLPIIKGIKLSLAGEIVAVEGIKMVELAKSLAKRFGLSLMVHVGDKEKKISSLLTQQFLPMMEAGDILTHVFTPQFGCPVSTVGAVLPELIDAMQRGVILDVAEGKSNFSFEVAKRGLAQGIFPTTLSTDLTTLSLNGPVYGLTVTMSKFIALGVELKRVIEMTTINPARALHIEQRKGSLRKEMDADISILELVDDTWRLEDSRQQTLKASKVLIPVMTIKSGRPIPAKLAALPQSGGG